MGVSGKGAGPPTLRRGFQRSGVRLTQPGGERVVMGRGGMAVTSDGMMCGYSH